MNINALIPLWVPQFERTVVEECSYEIMGDEDGIQINFMREGFIAGGIRIEKTSGPDLEDSKLVVRVWTEENKKIYGDDPDTEVTMFNFFDYPGTAPDAEGRSISDWPYSGPGGLEDNYLKGRKTRWVETDEGTYNDRLDFATPVKHEEDVFAVGKVCNDKRGVHTVFVKIGNRYFARYCDLSEWDPIGYKLEIDNQFNKLDGTFGNDA